MRKSLVTLLAAAACATSVAHADGTPITVDFTYDSTLLATEAGAKTVLASITEQAAEACTVEKVFTGVELVDRTCRDEMVEQAIEKISLAATEEGKEVSYVFASLD